MFKDGKPQYWIEWYDRWHLLLPLLLVALIGAAWWTQRASAEIAHEISGADRPANSPIRTLPDLRPINPTTIDTPSNGRGLTPSQLGNAEGRAEPGALVKLYYLGTSAAWTELGQIHADDTGHYRFLLTNFPPGPYRLRARAQTESGRTADSSDVLITVVPDPVPPRNPGRRSRHLGNR